MQYRREIDGLRALAVLPVMLFHAGFSTFGGGFVGVDVFFVISGYLITSLIRNEQKSGAFDLVSFYERRARRILPALFIMMALCIPFAWFWLLPRDMKEFSESLVSVPAFISNLLFWHQSGYFDTAADLKPLLHTWSLAIEEQFYLLFPLFLIISITRLNSRLSAVSTILFFSFVGVSLAIAQWGAHHYPAATYLLLPTRGWELLLGAICALYLEPPVLIGRRTRSPMTRALKQGASIVGLGLVCYAVFCFSDATPFPSLYALAPTLGAALIILFATPETLVGRLLASNLLVSIGLISYSAYLFHQPILAFARRAMSTDPSNIILFSLLLGTFGIAYLSYRFIETPFRRKQSISRAGVFAFALAGSLFFISFGLIGHFNGGFPDRLSGAEQAVAAYKNYNYGPVYRIGTCFLSQGQGPEVFSQECLPKGHNGTMTLIWGDSHAAALSYGFRQILGDDHLAQYSASGCPPLLGENFPERPTCRAINDFVADRISVLKPARIILHSAWGQYGRDVFPRGLERTLSSLNRNSPSSEIVVVGHVPQWAPSLPDVLVPNLLKIDYTYLPTDGFAILSQLDRILSGIAQKNGDIFISPLSLMCVNEKCLTVTDKGPPIKLTLWDSSHLTAEGSVFLATRIFDLLNEESPRRQSRNPDQHQAILIGDRRLP